MNAVVQFQPQQAVVPNFTISDMERVALAIAKGGLFGSSDPNAVLTLCMLAHAEGQHPAVVFRDYHIISGKPAKKSEAMQRDFLMAGGKIDWHRLDDDCVEATFSHPQGGSVTIAWDNARVAQAQLGGNAMHKKYPRQMKKARVIAEGVRTVWPGATSGLYETGEVQDIIAEQPAKPTPPAPKAQRVIEAQPEPEAPKQARQTADEWAAEFIGAIEATATLDSLDALWTKNQRPLAKLAKERGELCDQIEEVRNARLAMLSAEKRDEPDFGDQFDD